MAKKLSELDPFGAQPDDADLFGMSDADNLSQSWSVTYGELKQTGAQIKAAYEAEADTNAFDDAALAKLAGIEDGATADLSGSEIKTLYEGEADTNAYDDAAVAKLAGIEAGATADQTGAEIKTAYEAEADTNAYDDAAVAKLAGIEAGATGDQSDVEIEAAYDNVVGKVSAGEITAGTEPALRTYSPADVKAFVDQHGGAGGTDHGALTGLADDDHPQYLLADGSRALTGNMAVDALVTVDGRDISVDGAALDQAGLDIITNADAIDELAIRAATGFRAVKGTAGTINPGRVVYITGNLGGGVLQIEEATNDNEATNQPVGVTIAQITDSNSNIVITDGLVTGLDTSAFTSGDTIYLSKTTGAPTTTPPQCPNGQYYWRTGVISVAHASLGVISVKMDKVLDEEIINTAIFSTTTAAGNRDQAHSLGRIPEVVNFVGFNPGATSPASFWVQIEYATHTTTTFRFRHLYNAGTTNVTLRFVVY